MCRLSDAELNCVSTKIRLRPACRQLLIGMSISRYLPPIGTAGFERMWVSGKSRVPAAAAEDQREHVVHRAILQAVSKPLVASGFSRTNRGFETLSSEAAPQTLEAPPR